MMLSARLESGSITAMNTIYRSFRRWLYWGVGCGVLLQTGSCVFDSQAFFSSATQSFLENVASNFLAAGLSSLLNYTPTGSF
ncbi:MAG: hypothetical protein HJJLKODD_02390 [Phycisphaerae bacterium]|nr:hypothetical protein [Phycisphaerae bacterium]